MPNESALPVALSSRIESATVYRRGALIVRRVELPVSLFACANGHPVCARVTNLPLALKDSSVRVRIAPLNGSSGELPTVTDLRISLEAGQPDAALRPPKNEELEAARLDVDRVMAELKANEDASTALEETALAPRPKGEKSTPPPESPVEARFQYIAFRQERLRALQDERGALLIKLRHAEEQRRIMEDRERRATQARAPRPDELRKTAVITFRKPAGEVTPAGLLLEYHIPGATWAATYGLRLGSAGTRGEWSLGAVVAQSTGEDWKGVRLTLSTALPQEWTELPELPSIRIGRTQRPKARAGWRPAPQDTQALFADYARAFRGASQGTPLGRLISAEAAMGALGIDQHELQNLVARGDLRAVRSEGHMMFLAADVEVLSIQKRAVSTGMAAGAGESLSEPEPGLDRVMLKEKALNAVLGDMSVCDMEYVDVDEGSGAVAHEMTVVDQAATGTGPAAPPPPAPAAAQVRFSRAALGGRAGEAASPAVSRVRQPSVRRTAIVRRQEVESVELTAQQSMLDYGLLQLSAPGEGAAAMMGRLHLITRQELYLRLISQQHFEWAIDLEQVVDQAQRGAGKAEQLMMRSPYPVPYGPEGFDYAYPAETPIDIPSDGEQHAIPVLTRPAELRRIFVTVPREAPHVFRCVEFRNPLDAPLLAGPVDVTVDGDFLMTAPLKTVPAGGTVSLGLGVEESIRVARNTSYKEETSGLLGGDLLLTHHIAVSVQNNLAEAAEIEIRERLPHVEEEQKDEKIRVNVRSVEPPWEVYKQDDGGCTPLKAGYRWRLIIQPGDGRETQATYAISIPSKRQLTGGNRREEA